MALRSPALSGTQTSRSSGDSGWNMKTLAKVSDRHEHPQILHPKFYSNSWLSRCHRTRLKEYVGE